MPSQPTHNLFPSPMLWFTRIEFFAFSTIARAERKEQRAVAISGPVLCPGKGTGAALWLLSSRAMSSDPCLHCTSKPYAKESRKEASGLFQSGKVDFLNS